MNNEQQLYPPWNYKRIYPSIEILLIAISVNNSIRRINGIIYINHGNTGVNFPRDFSDDALMGSVGLANLNSMGSPGKGCSA